MKYLLNLVVIKPSTPQTITSEKATTHFAPKDPRPTPSALVHLLQLLSIPPDMLQISALSHILPLTIFPS